MFRVYIWCVFSVSKGFQGRKTTKTGMKLEICRDSLFKNISHPKKQLLSTVPTWVSIKWIIIVLTRINLTLVPWYIKQNLDGTTSMALFRCLIVKFSYRSKNIRAIVSKCYEKYVNLLTPNDLLEIKRNRLKKS